MSDTEQKPLDEMSMPELWTEAKRLGVPKDGKKDELIARLKEARKEGGENMPKDKAGKPKAAKTEKPQEAVFISKYNELRLVNQSSYTKEVNGRVVTVQGTSVQFRDGVYRTSDPDEIAFLESHPNFGSAFTRVQKKDQNKATDQLISERYKTLEQKEAELKAKEEALKKREMALKGQEEGAETPKTVSGVRSTADRPKF